LRRDPRDFSRDGLLSPELLVTLLLYMVGDANRRGYRHLLEAFWDEARAHGLPLPCEEPVSAPSFCEARHKITPDLLKHVLHQIAVGAFGPRSICRQRWHGRRVFAADGSKINVRRGDDLHRAFGTPNGAHCPQALVTVLFDVCAKLPIDVEVASHATSERAHLLQMMESFEAGDLLVLDRGFPSHEIVQELVCARVDFLMRIPERNTFAVADRLREGDARDLATTIELPEGSPQWWRPIELRAVKLRAPDGTESYFLTTLARGEFTLKDLSELYHMRWEVEEYFKLFKGGYIGQGLFRSQSASGVVQEMYTLILLLAITRLCMSAAARAATTPGELSQKGAVLAMAAHVTRILLAPTRRQALEQIQILLRRIARVREPRRAGRSYPRRSYLPARRWGPKGRPGA
jgi:hypothetical protein